MIETTCSCGAAVRAPESQANENIACAKCGVTTKLTSAEALGEGAGFGDFDAVVSVDSGDDAASDSATQYFLGGVPDIAIGKLADKQIVLGGTRVSRFHCKLVRVDFGPSRWKVVDNRSTNGTFVNGEQVTERELRDGDVITVGENKLTFRIAPPPPPPDAVSCPSCGKYYAKRSKICVTCGIDLRTGKPLLTSQHIDEDTLQVNAENTIRVLSWIIPFGLYPIASEAFGGKRPIVTFAIAALTVVISVWFFFASEMYTDPGGVRSKDVATLMLWTGKQPTAQDIDRELRQIPGFKDISKEDLKEILDEANRDSAGQNFQPYQLITHAFLHGGVMHLAGNMLFLLVFGTRVNALIGNIATAIVYPILAVCAGAAHLIMMRHEVLHPMLGASGAIMGFAGMYFILFPVHRVFMAIWFRGGILTGWRVFWKVWPLRGFWVVLFYIAFDVVFTALRVKDGTAHWAHLGGFGFGMLFALIMLLSRLVDAHRADLISVTLGRRAWLLLGRPGNTATAMAA